MKRFWRYLLPLALLTAEDKDRLAYIIPRLSVSEENKYFYVIPGIWDFWVNKTSGQIYVHYQGLDDTLTPFDPASDTALSFAG